MSADIEWLQRRWGLEACAVPEVAALIQEERESGSTAHPLPPGNTGWGKAVANSADNCTSPLLIIRHEGANFLQSRRLFLAEKAIAENISRLRTGIFPPPDEKLLGDLFPEASPDDLQLKAARTALSRELTLITGGPGTGKTHTLARILALLALLEIPSGAIRLAAPTGKAAERMKRAVSDCLESLPAEFSDKKDTLVKIAASSTTLHSLLGYNPSMGGCRFDSENPLRCSVLIVDECSMVDTLLWKALFEALPKGARLILIGDPNQLQSVGQGNVFAELSQYASRKDSALSPSLIHLTNARRFKDRPGILDLAEAIQEQDPEKAAAILQKSTGNKAATGLTWLNVSHGTLPINDFPTPIMEAIQTVASASKPGEAITAFGKVCILSAHREYFVGAKSINAQIDNYLGRLQEVQNRPIIVNENDPETGLRNGTVGVISVDETGKKRAYFPWGDGSIREFPVAKLPDYSSAWAITIHRSQGSEYDDVLVVLPREESPMATRELLYTAITRARKNVYIVGSLDSVRSAVKTSSVRVTLLAAALESECS